VAASGRVIAGDDDLPGWQLFLPKPYRGACLIAAVPPRSPS
jgi:hypothetical protein